MVTANDQALPSVNDLDLPFFDYNEPGLVGELYHRRLAEVRRKGWLARSPLALVVLDQESGEFFLRARDTAFPGREIADLFGVTGGRLREQIDANILNQTGLVVVEERQVQVVDRGQRLLRHFLAFLAGR